MPNALEDLRGECTRISMVVLDLPEEDFAKPTRLPAWNVKQLCGHMYRDVDRINAGLDALPPAEVDVDSVSYWRAYDPVADGPDIAERGKAIAAEFDSGHALAEAWDETWHRTLQRASLQDGSRRVVTWGPVLTLDEHLKTRILEIVVHGLDLADALGRHPWATRAGLQVTTGILSALLGTQPPIDLRWDDVTFIEKGTGRRELDAHDREAIGGMAERFPLMG